MNRTRRQLAVVAAVFAASMTSGCDWVDSAGNGGGSTGSVITINGQPLGSAVSLQEKSFSRVLVTRLSGDDATVYEFDNTPLAEGALDTCLSLNGFDAEHAVGSLGDACSGAETDCRFIAQDDPSNSNELAFSLDVPELRAPVGRRHSLRVGQYVTDEFAQTTFVEDFSTEIDFCLISINEAPEAIADTYVLVEGGVLDLDAAVGVLANDIDDDDVRNESLRVTATVEEPTFDNRFELREDGGFTYSFAPSGIREDVIDRFTYRVSDGSQTSDGMATIRIVASNQAPVVLDMPDPYFAMVGEFFEEDLSVLFEDPEGLDMAFSFIEDLPADGDLELSSDGVLSGTPDNDDEGEFGLTLVADDGENTTETMITLIIEAPENSAPEFVQGTVFSQTVDFGDRIEDVEPEFEDPDNDTLTYRNAGANLPRGLSVNSSTGVLSGRPRLRGLFTGLVIEAQDSAGNTAESDSFFIRVL